MTSKLNRFLLNSNTINWTEVPSFSPSLIKSTHSKRDISRKSGTDTHTYRHTHIYKVCRSLQSNLVLLELITLQINLASWLTCKIWPGRPQANPQISIFNTIMKFKSYPITVWIKINHHIIIPTGTILHVSFWVYDF